MTNKFSNQFFWWVPLLKLSSIYICSEYWNASLRGLLRRPFHKKELSVTELGIFCCSSTGTAYNHRPLGAPVEHYCGAPQRGRWCHPDVQSYRRWVIHDQLCMIREAALGVPYCSGSAGPSMLSGPVTQSVRVIWTHILKRMLVVTLLTYIQNVLVVTIDLYSAYS
jgi:hypothetical protein